MEQPAMRLDHVLIRTRDLDAMRVFFTDGIGLEVGPRPAFSFSGYWLYAHGQPVIHLRDLGGLEPPAGGGPAWPFDHVAFAGDDYRALVARLEANGISFREQELPGGGVHQVFATGPDGVRVEIQFPAAAVA
jgi:catechol 2,3-dioxygenase-like lactoylglutathione lyase family enzyme